MTAHRAFQFCKQYKRTTEFRRLCEIIRNHLANLNKYRDQRDRPDLSAPESLQLYLDTRFEQLKVATELKLWQVCFFIYLFVNYYVFLYIFVKCKQRSTSTQFTYFSWSKNHVSFVIISLVFSAGSLSISWGHSWIDVHGQENAQGIHDGCLLC